MDEGQNVPTIEPQPPTDLGKTLENLMVERLLRAQASPTKCVAYMDMLGFGSLVTAHPGAFNVDIDPDGSVGTSTSKSSAPCRHSIRLRRSARPLCPAQRVPT